MAEAGTVRSGASVPDEVRVAVANNVSWCAAMCRAHGVTGRLRSRDWVSSRRTPPFFPDAITVSPHARAGEVLAAIDTSPGCSVKDSFAALALGGAGFTVLFEAYWIHRPAGSPAGAAHPGWLPVRDAHTLRAWERAWRGGSGEEGLFPPRLLSDPDVLVLAERAGGRIVAGAVAYRGGAAVGLSNVFAAHGDLGGTWSAVLAAVTPAWPGLPVVGYERGPDLDAAVRHGFVRTGALRVWMRP